MSMNKPFRVVVAKPGLDGHDRGATGTPTTQIVDYARERCAPR